MKYKFHAVIHLLIEASEDDFKLIWESCKHHYDATVRSLVEVGGFIYGYRNIRDFSDNKDKDMELTERQIGLVIKSLEMNHTQEAQNLSNELYSHVEELHQTYYSSNEKFKYKEHTT